MKTTEIREFHTPSSGIFFRAKKRLLSEKTPYQKLEVYETDSFGRVLLLDGLVQTTEKDEYFYHEMLVHPSMMSHPSPKDILIVGGGDGGALREALRHPVRSVVLVEIDVRVIQACREHFPGLAASFSDRRVQIAVADGSRYVREADRRFDVIIVDSSDPVGPSAILHRQTFYRALKKCLRTGGVIAAQAGAPLFHLDHLREKRRFLKKLFKWAPYYLGPVPTYPAGLWCYVFLSNQVDPLRTPRRHPPKKLRFYNPDVHRAAFALPEFLRDK